MSYALLSLFVSACTVLFPGIILEYQDKAELKVSESRQNGQIYLAMSSSTMPSGLVVDDVETKEDFDAEWVYMHLKLVDSGAKSGDVAYAMPMPEHVRTVRFGKHGVIIWQR